MRAVAKPAHNVTDVGRTQPKAPCAHIPQAWCGRCDSRIGSDLVQGRRDLAQVNALRKCDNEQIGLRP
jgi:hypothetical protein